MNPIITSLIDTDAYKLFMQQAVFNLYPDTLITAEFRCRNEEELGSFVHLIKQQIDTLSDLQLTNEEYLYLTSLNLFSKKYLDWLKDYRFKPSQVQVQNIQGKLSLNIEGTWLDAILWEIPLLAIISEVSHKALQQKSDGEIVSSARTRLTENLDNFVKQAQLRKIDLTGFKLIEFGTRRRYSFQIQQTVIDTLNDYCIPASPNFFMGTSNLFFAHQFNITPVGTQAHEWFQAHQQLSPTLKDSQHYALEQWLKVYPNQLSIALTDCINMDAFLRDFTLPLAQRYTGLRHDSGDPIAWGEKAIEHYKKLGIDPAQRHLVFSDNLDLDKALDIYEHFFNHISTSFGIGTRLTCNIPGVKPHNIVIKLTSCNGKPVAKISDEPGKIICNDTGFIKQLAKAFNVNV